MQNIILKVEVLKKEAMELDNLVHNNISLFYGLFSRELSNKLHEEREKSFSYFVNHEVIYKYTIFDREFKIIVSTSNEGVLNELLHLKDKIIKMRETTLKVSFDKLQLQEIKEAKIYHLEPYLAIHTTRKKDSPKSQREAFRGSDYEEVEEQFSNSINRICKKLNKSESAKFYFNENSIKEYIQKDKFLAKRFAYKKGFVSGFRIDFFISGVDREVIEYILTNGLGGKVSLGLGKVRLLGYVDED